MPGFFLDYEFAFFANQLRHALALTKRDEGVVVRAYYNDFFRAPLDFLPVKVLHNETPHLRDAEVLCEARGKDDGFHPLIRAEGLQEPQDFWAAQAVADKHPLVPRLSHEFHSMLMEGKPPLTMGGASDSRGFACSSPEKRHGGGAGQPEACRDGGVPPRKG